jgi:hypothetical protein
MERLEPGEQVIATIYRHPFGIFIIYFQVILGLGAATALVAYILPNFVNRDNNPGVYSLAILVLLVIAAFLVIVLIIATIIYHQSKLVITNKSITQVTQEGLFNRKISQLAVSNIEDATANRRGVFQSILNFGVLNVETAGETENFYFYYCPDPDKYAKTVLELREQFLANRERDKQEAGQTYMTMQQAQQYAQYPTPMPASMPMPPNGPQPYYAQQPPTGYPQPTVPPVPPVYGQPMEPSMPQQQAPLPAPMSPAEPPAPSYEPPQYPPQQQ